MLNQGLDAERSHLPTPEAETGSSSPEFGPDTVRNELRRILDSGSFRTSRRGSQFLNFVVQYQLEGHAEPLKERTIGVALFNRAVDYATGDDSVVRAQAREVRRRLERYYIEHPPSSGMRIELPLGSYTPEFTRVESHPSMAVTTILPPLREEKIMAEYSAPVLPVANISQKKSWPKFLIGTTVALVAILCGSIAFRMVGPIGYKRTISQFWAPSLASSRPILICLPKPVLYRPSPIVYEHSARWPGEFDREVDRMTHPPHLGPDDSVRWGDMLQFYDYGISQGDVQAAVRLSSFLGQFNKESEVRIGDGYSTEDLRNSPAVVIGAFSNPRAVEMTSSLYFSFADDSKGIRIQEQGPSGRSWYTKHGVSGEDYGLVTRLVDSNTGQFVVLVAGIEASGSDAAAELVVSPGVMKEALQIAPRDWSQKDIQILVSTSVKDSVAGPPKVIAVHVW